MASMGEIAECLSATLSPNANTRMSAELKLADYLSSPGPLQPIFLRLFAPTSHPLFRRVDQTRH